MPNLEDMLPGNMNMFQFRNFLENMAPLSFSDKVTMLRWYTEIENYTKLKYLVESTTTTAPTLENTRITTLTSGITYDRLITYTSDQYYDTIRWVGLNKYNLESINYNKLNSLYNLDTIKIGELTDLDIARLRALIEAPPLPEIDLSGINNDLGKTVGILKAVGLWDMGAFLPPGKYALAPTTTVAPTARAVVPTTVPGTTMPSPRPVFGMSPSLGISGIDVPSIASGTSILSDVKYMIENSHMYYAFFGPNGVLDIIANGIKDSITKSELLNDLRNENSDTYIAIENISKPIEGLNWETALQKIKGLSVTDWNNTKIRDWLEFDLISEKFTFWTKFNGLKDQLYTTWIPDKISNLLRSEWTNNDFNYMTNLKSWVEGKVAGVPSVKDALIKIQPSEYEGIGTLRTWVEGKSGDFNLIDNKVSSLLNAVEELKGSFRVAMTSIGTNVSSLKDVEMPSLITNIKDSNNILDTMNDLTANWDGILNTISISDDSISTSDDALLALETKLGLENYLFSVSMTTGGGQVLMFTGVGLKNYMTTEVDRMKKIIDENWEIIQIPVLYPSKSETKKKMLKEMVRHTKEVMKDAMAKKLSTGNVDLKSKLSSADMMANNINTLTLPNIQNKIPDVGKWPWTQGAFDSKGNYIPI